MKNKQELIDHLQAGNQVKYLHFWGHTQKGKSVDKSCLSQWFPATFVIDKEVYVSAEQYMMVEKAYLFDDTESVTKILSTSSPAEAKKLGRQVTNFNSDRWNDDGMKVVIKGNLAKFRQNQKFKEFLLSTKDRVLVEASPRDITWGIGMGVNDPNACKPENWQGRNLLGFALMQVRETLLESN